MYQNFYTKYVFNTNTTMGIGTTTSQTSCYQLWLKFLSIKPGLNTLLLAWLESHVRLTARLQEIQAKANSKVSETRARLVVPDPTTGLIVNRSEPLKLPQFLQYNFTTYSEIFCENSMFCLPGKRRNIIISFSRESKCYYEKWLKKSRFFSAK